MYFPQLKNLEKEHKYSSEVINALDHWLASIPAHKKDCIIPTRFATDVGISYDVANELFILAVAETEILKINYEIQCPICEDVALIVSNINDIPPEIECWEGHRFFPHDHPEMIEISFSLTKKPLRGISKRAASFSPHKVLQEKKSPSVKFDHLVKNDNYRGKILNEEYFNPDWNKLEELHERFKNSFEKSVSTEEKGKSLERLSCYLMSYVVPFEVDPDIHTLTNQVDLTIRVRPHRYFHPFLRFIGPHIICECKNENENVCSTWVDKVYGLAVKTDCRFGIIFSRNRLAGTEWKSANGSRRTYMLRDKKFIIDITKDDLDKVITEHYNFLTLIEDKFAQLKLLATTPVNFVENFG